MSAATAAGDAAIGEAPGRLDVLGGVSDYSGGLVLQTPLQRTTRVRISSLAERVVRLASVQAGTVSLPLPVSAEAEPADQDVAARCRAWLDAHAVPPWARYPLGCLALFCDHFGWTPAGGLAIEISSDVPTSMGVSSSAALEVATLRALESLTGQAFTGTQLARLGQRAENEIVGAPCGLMDQLAVAHGVAGSLLPIRCRPDLLGPPVPLPAGTVVAGWPSGVTHAVSGSPYRTARTAAFMARRILAETAGRPLAFLTELAPSAVADVGRDVLPEAMSGAAFLTRFGRLADPLSLVEPEQTYPVRAAAAFAAGETFRSSIAVGLLAGQGGGCHPATIGELLYQSHRGYSAIGLGAPETDAMVAALRSLGPERGVYGGRISGGGCGGTVVVLLDEAALPSLANLAAEMTGTAIIR